MQVGSLPSLVLDASLKATSMAKVGCALAGAHRAAGAASTPVGTPDSWEVHILDCQVHDAVHSTSERVQHVHSCAGLLPTAWCDSSLCMPRPASAT